MVKENRYRFDAKLKDGTTEEFTGHFRTREIAREWNRKHGKFFANLGIKLVSVKTVIYLNSKLA